MTEALQAFLETGIMGAVAVLSIYVNWRLYRDLRDERRRRESIVEEMNKEFAKESAALRERLVAKAETWMAKYYELAEGMKKLLVAQRSRRDSDRAKP